ncbi:uncharacterized protein [Musca autumnalis]|uniref:uncharacterized protein n=1 Tax=Musca autumnalis TaxID=221902 RepID=UPI003CEE919A
MSQEKQQRSKRSTQGKPPVRFDAYITEMSLQHSPPNTPTNTTSGARLQTDVSTPASQPSTAKPTTSAAAETAKQKQTEKSATMDTAEMRKEMLKMQKQIQLQMQQQMQQQLQMQTLLQNQMLQLKEEMVKTFASQQPKTSVQNPQPQTSQQQIFDQPLEPPLTSQQPISQPTQHITTPPTLEIPPPLPDMPQSIIRQPEPTHVTQGMSVQYMPAQGQPNNSINTANTNYNNMPQKKIYPLPIFSGLPEEWPTFSESFYSTTNEFMYSDLHNIMRLRDALRGNARETVEPLLGSSANVEAIMLNLKEMFGRPEQLIKSQIMKVRKIPPLAKDDLNALINFATKTSNMATFLKNAEGEHHLHNPSLLSELVAKLPINRQMEWGEKCLSLNESPSILHFSAWLQTLRRVANIVHDTLPYAPYVSTNRQQPTKPSRQIACVAVNNCSVCDGVCTSITECKQFADMQTDEKWNKIKELKLCFCCLRKGHQLNQCRNRVCCGKNNCNKFHNVLLHYDVDADEENENDSGRVQPQQRNCHAVSSADDGANVTMLDSGIASDLKLRGNTAQLSLQWLNNHSVVESSEVVDVTISGIGRGDRQYVMKNVYTTSNMSLPIQSCDIKKLVTNNNVDVSKIKFVNYKNVQPKLIISLHHCFLTVPLDVPRSLSAAGPIVTTTRLGVVVYGPTPGGKASTKNRALHVRMCATSTESPEDNLRQMSMMQNNCDVKILDAKVNTKKKLPNDDECAVKLLRSQSRKIDGRYECLLWKQNVPQFPDSYDMVLKNLYIVENKMVRDREHCSAHCERTCCPILMSYARKVNVHELLSNPDPLFHLPHSNVTIVNANVFVKNSTRADEPNFNTHYVDDYFQNEEEAAKVIEDVIRIHSVGGFELRNIMSNSKRVIQTCGESASGVNDSGEFLNQNVVEGILGIHWLPNPDVFSFRDKFILDFANMLSLKMFIYGTFGFICKFVVASKMLIRRVWKSGIESDEELPSDLYNNWKIWLTELNMLEGFRISRRYLKDFSNRKVDLHIFAYAIEEAMATVAYWCVIHTRLYDGCSIAATGVIGNGGRIF